MAKDSAVIVAVKPESEGPEFTLPDGVDFSDVKKGDEKEVTAVLKNYGGGRVCLIKVNGVPISDDTEEEPDEDEGNEPPTPDNSQASYNMAGSSMGSGAAAAGLM